MEHFNTGSTTHLTRKSSQFLSPVPIWTSEVSLGWGSVLAKSLATKSTSGVVSLVLVELLYSCLWPRSFWKGPPREILLGRWVGWGLRDIAARTNCSGGRSLVFEAGTTTSVSKSILRVLLSFGFIFNEVLGTRVCIVVPSGHSWLSANLGCTNSGSSAVVSLDRVI